MDRTENKESLAVPDFDLRQLEIFCKVVELRGFSSAARAVGLSQASVSERVATLEQQVGARLLDRGGRQVTPTRAGELLLRHARALLGMKQRACLELEELLGVRRGELLMGGSTVPGEALLPGVIGQFCRRHPGVTVRLAVAGSTAIARRVAEGELELGVVGSRAPSRGLVHEELWGDELLLVVPAGHRWAGLDEVSVEELSGEPVVVREPGSGTRRLLEQRLGEAGTVPLTDLRVAAELGSSAAIREGVKAGLGVSVISRRAVQDALASGELAGVRLRGVDLRRTFYLVRHGRQTLSPAGEAMADLLRQLARRGDGA